MATATIPLIFINRQKYDVVIPRDRRGGTLRIGPGQCVVGPYMRCVDAKGIQQLIGARPADYAKAIDPLGLAAEYLRGRADAPKPAISGKPSSAPTEPVFEGRTRQGWVDLFKATEDEELLTYKAAALREIAAFLRVDLKGATAKSAMIGAIRGSS